MPFGRLFGGVTVMLVMAGAIAGCAIDPAKQILGTWKVTAAANPQIPAHMRSFFSQAVLSFQPKTFTLTDMQPIFGNYTVHDRTVTLNVTQVAGKPIAELTQYAPSLKRLEHMEATLSPDGRSLTLTNFGNSTTFTKENP